MYIYVYIHIMYMCMGEDLATPSVPKEYCGCKKYIAVKTCTSSIVQHRIRSPLLWATVSSTPFGPKEYSARACTKTCSAHLCADKGRKEYSSIRYIDAYI